MPNADRRIEARTPCKLWPEAMRDEYRKVDFLAGVGAEEVELDGCRNIFASFEGRHIRFI